VKRFLLGILVAALGCGVTAWAGDMEQGGHGGHDAKPHWGYTGAAGPAHWGNLSPEFSACRDGRSQSPIDITGAMDIDQPRIKFAYKPVPVTMINNGHTVQINYPSTSTINVAGETFQLVQFHFHTPSENAVDGGLFPMEAHLVHKNASGKLAVVGVLFKEGDANPFLDKFWSYMPSKANSDVILSNLKINVADLLPANKDYYSWEGSLTTPPCTEGVQWMVLKEVVEVSPEQVRKLEEAVKGHNNRPVQPLYGRVIDE